ncbi:Protein fem-1-like protein C-like [Oopsacas minuta]|uniref:Protein fem-1-like protein C-like n=1 Tax=Oopsacas minuta TaxID=111878 RepID=A0AAV7KKM4_9METZ|nr:Protein fem-1-like protein C-like [Oopsacas minuta]
MTEEIFDSLTTAAHINDIDSIRTAFTKPPLEQPTLAQVSHLLVIASQKGSTDCIQYLIGLPQIDLESSCDIVSDFTEKKISGATPLWAASLGGHTEVVKILIEGGADVNHGTTTKSSPLRAASFHNRLEVINYLIANGADLDAPNIAGQSPLMIAALRNHRDSVELLAQRGADINLGSTKGLTPLHAVCVKGHLDIVKLLINLGAKLDFLSPTPELQFTFITPCPLFQAAAYGQLDVVRFLTSLPQCTPTCAVDAILLYGASSFNLNRTVESALTYWIEAITLKREENVETEYLPPNPAYGYIKEVSSVGSMVTTSDWVIYQSMVMRERILGPFYHLTSYYTFATARYLLSHKHFESAELIFIRALWMASNSPIADIGYALEDFNDNLRHLNRSILNFIKNEYRVNIASLFELTFPHLRRIIQSGDVKEENEFFETALKRNLELIAIWLGYLPDTPNEHNLSLLKERDLLVKSFCDEFSSTQTGNTLSHILVLHSNKPDDAYKDYGKCRPNLLPLVPYLSRLTDPTMLNTLNEDGKTPLHIAVKSEFASNLVCSLIACGAHVDMSDNTGHTAIHLASTTTMSMLLTQCYYPLALTCLSARAIQRHCPGYVTNLPTQLQLFVNIHNTCKHS